MAAAEPADAHAAVRARDLADYSECWLCVWPDPQPEGTVAIDVRVVGPAASARISLVLAWPEVRIPFDDPAVAQARRRLLGGPAPTFVTSLVHGDGVFAGSIVGLPHDGFVDPFAQVFTARRFDVEPGLFRPGPAPAGPVIERYGARNPWPWGRFSP